MSPRQLRKRRNRKRIASASAALTAVVASGVGAAWAGPPWDQHLDQVATAEPTVMDGQIYIDHIAIGDDYVSAASGRPEGPPRSR